MELVCRFHGVGTTVTGVRCPICSSQQGRVVDSRTAEDGTAIRRRRECLDCGHRFTTFERCSQILAVVIKRSGARVPFEVGKVEAGIRSAAKGRPLSEELIREVAESIADGLTAGGGDITSESIGLAILDRLRDLDPVAYVRFASVYKGFEDPADFERELGLLAKMSPPKTT
jgi:transcriptional repressor NrdR